MSQGVSSETTLVVLATYNELANLPELTDEIFRYAPDVHVLVVDDNSPDGTGRWCDQRAATDSRFQVLHRPGKLGLGTATIAGMRHALEHDYAFVLVMDADFSHHPRYLPDLRGGMQAAGPEPPVDVMIGSRYLPGGGIEGWPWRRRWASRAVNRYFGWWLRLPVHDISGAFRCYRTSVLRRLDLAAVRARGYAFEEEILWWLHRQHARLGETPIVFTDRRHGVSKVDFREAWSACWHLFCLGLRGWFRGGR
jgi:dolichol-phosphate mannosyltransferase